MDRALKPGEVFYSVVYEDDEDFVRRDISAEAWTGPPEGAVGWWKGKMPEAGTGRMKLAPSHVLLELVKQMADQPEREAVCFLLALMLMRKRVLRPVESEHPGQNDHMLFEVVADGTQIEVRQCEIPAQQRDQLRDDLTELLYCEVEEA